MNIYNTLEVNKNSIIYRTDISDILVLELGTSIVKLNQLRDYWDTGTFLGHKDFSSVMGRDIYLGTHAFLRLHPYMRYSDD